MTNVSNQEAARYQAAVSCLGQRIARLSARLAEERARDQRDDASIAALSDQREGLTDMQESLEPSDVAGIDRILAEA